MKPHPIIIVCFLVLLAACGNNGIAAMRPEVEVEMSNKSSRDLENAEALFGEYTCRWGWVVKATSASYMYYPYPITAKAELRWDAAGKHHVENVDLRKIYQDGKSGRLTFTVYDDRVEVHFREENKK